MRAIDYMRIIFNNTQLILDPNKQDKLPIPNGYEIVIKLPPQTRVAYDYDLA